MPTFREYTQMSCGHSVLESPPRHYHLQQFHPRSAAADVLPAVQQAIQQCSSCRRIISQQQSAITAFTPFMLVSLEACNFLEHHQSHIQTSHPCSAAAVSLLTFEQARQQVCSCRRSSLQYLCKRSIHHIH